MFLSWSFEFWSFEFVSDFGFRISSLAFVGAFSQVIETESEKETEALGEHLASCLASGDILALYGELGAGKTCLVRGLARGLGVDESTVASPSFTLINEYEGRLPLAHLDCYRLHSPEDIEELGLDDYFAGGRILVIEWAERIPDLPAEGVKITIEWVDENRRRIRLEAEGELGRRLEKCKG
jgi:tRNA threonylcarbamoyladenosine biosynthesis protein TsaE